MRIVHVVPSLDPAAGGPPVVAACLAGALAERGHEVRLVSEFVPPTLTVPGVRVCQLPRPDWKRYFTGGETETALAEVLAWADVAHLHGVWESLVYRSARLAKSFHKPYVLAPHGMLDPWSLNQKKWKKRIALAVAYRGVLNDGTLHLLNDDESRLIRPLKLRSRVAVIPNGVNLRDIPPADDGAFRAAVPRLGSRNYVLFLGRLHFKKGLDILSAAWAKVADKYPETDLVVCGPDDGARAAFELDIRRLNLSDRVHLLGPVYGPMKWSALAGAAAFVLPSRQEGFSMAVLEALACGVPAVVTTECHFPEVAAAGAVTTLDPGSVAEGLDGILSDPETAKKLGENGRSLVAGRFTWPAVAARCDELYRSLT